MLWHRKVLSMSWHSSIKSYGLAPILGPLDERKDDLRAKIFRVWIFLYGFESSNWITRGRLF